MGDGNKIHEQFRCPVTYCVCCDAVCLWAEGRKKGNDRPKKTSELILKKNT
jgi:hypothetical protein